MVSAMEKLAEHGDCRGCGSEAAVVYEDIALCGSCFYIASLTAVRRAQRLVMTAAADRVSETASMIANLVETVRNRGGSGRER